MNVSVKEAAASAQWPFWNNPSVSEAVTGPWKGKSSFYESMRQNGNFGFASAFRSANPLPQEYLALDVLVSLSAAVEDRY